jgi:hypothetical protein
MNITRDDALMLVGDAHARKLLLGETDMPKALMDLAKRIAIDIGDQKLADRISEIEAQDTTP